MSAEAFNINQITKGNLLAAIRAEQGRRSYAYFIKEAWSTIVANDLVWNWHLDIFCNEIQEVVTRALDFKPRKHDLIVNVPPGTSKSSCCSVFLTPWIWTLPNGAAFRSLNASHSINLSTDLATKCRDVVHSQFYQDTYSAYEFSKIRQDVGGKLHFQNEAKGERYAYSVGSNIVGVHALGHILDDPIDPMTIQSLNEMKKANTWVDSSFRTRKLDKQATFFLLVMQRLHEVDYTGHLISRYKKKRGPKPYKHICLPARASDKIYPPELAELYKDNLLDPIRLPESVLKETELELGAMAFSAQYMQHPVPAEGGLFKVGRMGTMTPALPQLEKIVRYWDKAGTDKKKDPRACYTCGVLMGRTKDRKIIILDIVRGQWDTGKREQVILEESWADYKKYAGIPYEVWTETEPSSSGKESAENTLQNLMGLPAYADRVSADKIIRADPFSTWVNRNMVFISDELESEMIEAFKAELAMFPRGRYKDQVDASAGAFAKLATNRKKAGVAL